MSRISIALNGFYVFTPDEVNYMVTEEIRSRYSPSQETKILRLYLADPVANKAAFDEYNEFVEACRAEGKQARTDAQAVRDRLDVEALALAEALAIESAAVIPADAAQLDRLATGLSGV